MTAMIFSEFLTDVNFTESHESTIQFQISAIFLMSISYQTHSNTVNIQINQYSKAAYKIDAALLFLYHMTDSFCHFNYPS